MKSGLSPWLRASVVGLFPLTGGGTRLILGALGGLAVNGALAVGVVN